MNALTDDRRSWATTIAVAVIAGSLFGPLDLAGQVHTPYPLAHLFNSPAVWAAGAFVFGAWARTRHLAAVVMMVVAVEAYYLADVVVRDANVANLTSRTALVWLVLGVGAGVVFGTAGGWSSSSLAWQRAVSAALLPAVFGSEAVHRFIEHATTAPGAGRDDDLSYGAIVAVIAVTLLAFGLRDRTRPERTRIAGLTLALVVVGSMATTTLFA